jgi:tetratricopeptide (TPR) repeat protein
MSSAVVNSDRLVRLLSLPLLLIAVWAMRPLESRLTVNLPAGEPVSLESGSPAVLGGWRAVAAGGAWLRANLAWERRDAATTRALLELSVTADPRTLHFWLNAARMMAYDFPAWRADGAPLAVRERMIREEAERALVFLERGLSRHPARAEIYLEMANIRLRALGDREGAAELFRRAAEQPGAPFHAARIHAELLRELGRPDEALAWLRRILPGLPANDPAARREVVEQRIKELESLLGQR